MNDRRINVVTLALLSALLFGGEARADPNEGVLDIESFLGTQASEDTVRAVRFGTGYDNQLSSPSSPDSNSHNITSYFGGTDNKYDQRPADNNEPFLIRLLQNDPTTENKTSKLKFSFPYDPDYMFGNKPIIFESDRLPHGNSVAYRGLIFVSTFTEVPEVEAEQSPTMMLLCLPLHLFRWSYSCKMAKNSRNLV